MSSLTSITTPKDNPFNSNKDTQQKSTTTISTPTLRTNPNVYFSPKLGWRPSDPNAVVVYIDNRGITTGSTDNSVKAGINVRTNTGNGTQQNSDIIASNIKQGTYVDKSGQAVSYDPAKANPVQYALQNNIAAALKSQDIQGFSGTTLNAQQIAKFNLLNAVDRKSASPYQEYYKARTPQGQIILNESNKQSQNQLKPNAKLVSNISKPYEQTVAPKEKPRTLFQDINNSFPNLDKFVESKGKTPGRETPLGKGAKESMFFNLPKDLIFGGLRTISDRSKGFGLYTTEQLKKDESRLDYIGTREQEFTFQSTLALGLASYGFAPIIEVVAPIVFGIAAGKTLVDPESTMVQKVDSALMIGLLGAGAVKSLPKGLEITEKELLGNKATNIEALKLNLGYTEKEGLLGEGLGRTLKVGRLEDNSLMSKQFSLLDESPYKNMLSEPITEIRSGKVKIGRIEPLSLKEELRSLPAVKNYGDLVETNFKETKSGTIRIPEEGLQEKYPYFEKQSEILFNKDVYNDLLSEPIKDFKVSKFNRQVQLGRIEENILPWKEELINIAKQKPYEDLLEKPLKDFKVSKANKGEVKIGRYEPLSLKEELRNLPPVKNYGDLVETKFNELKQGTFRIPEEDIGFANQFNSLFKDPYSNYLEGKKPLNLKSRNTLVDEALMNYKEFTSDSMQGKKPSDIVKGLKDTLLIEKTPTEFEATAKGGSSIGAGYKNKPFSFNKEIEHLITVKKGEGISIRESEAKTFHELLHRNTNDLFGKESNKYGLQPSEDFAKSMERLVNDEGKIDFSRAVKSDMPEVSDIQKLSLERVKSKFKEIDVKDITSTKSKQTKYFKEFKLDEPKIDSDLGIKSKQTLVKQELKPEVEKLITIEIKELEPQIKTKIKSQKIEKSIFNDELMEKSNLPDIKTKSNLPEVKTKTNIELQEFQKDMQLTKESLKIKPKQGEFDFLKASREFSLYLNPRTKESTKNKYADSMISEMSIQLPKLDQPQRFGQPQRFKDALDFAQPSKLKEDQAQRERQKERTSTKQIFDEENTKENRLFLSDGINLKQSNKDKQGYNVYIKEPKSKSFSKISTNSLSKSQALNFMAYEVDNSTARSGYIKPTNSKPKPLNLDISDEYFNTNSDKFRQFKVRSGNKIPIKGYIEKSNYLIDSYGEKQQLSAFKLRSKLKESNFNYAMNL